jgi:D-sedoheptulose 7-phosphate isomerase
MIDKQKYIYDTLSESADLKIKLKELCADDIIKSVNLLVEAIKKGKKILLCGNGGSAADCQHIATELVIRFRHDFKRPSIPAFAITTDTSNITAGGNDIGFENTFARSVEGLGSEGDILWAISTSGNSENIIRAVNKAKEKGMKIIGFLGNDGGKLLNMCEVSILIPSDETARIQECHITVAHMICYLLEMELYSK